MPEIETVVDVGKPSYTVGHLGVEISLEQFEAGMATELRLAEIERRILALEENQMRLIKITETVTDLVQP
jgi:hypothetical protein